MQAKTRRCAVFMLKFKSLHAMSPQIRLPLFSNLTRQLFTSPDACIVQSQRHLELNRRPCFARATDGSLAPRPACDAANPPSPHPHHTTFPSLQRLGVVVRLLQELGDADDAGRDGPVNGARVPSGAQNHEMVGPVPGNQQRTAVRVHLRCRVL